MSAFLTSEQKYKERQARIASLRKLEEGWDSYGGQPPTRKALREAESCLSSFDRPYLPLGHPVPLSNGGIQLEWHCGGFDVELEISPDGYLQEIGFCDGDGDWVEGDFLDHAQPLYRAFETMNERCRERLAELASERAGEQTAELARLREALLSILTVDNTSVRCARCRGDQEATQCGCYVALDADEKARLIALDALRLGEVR